MFFKQLGHIHFAFEVFNLRSFLLSLLTALPLLLLAFPATHWELLCTMKAYSLAASATLFALAANAFRPGPVIQSRPGRPTIQISPRQLPAEPTGVQTVVSPNGVNITYKEPGKEGICETTPGVSSVIMGFVEPGSDGCQQTLCMDRS